MIKKTINTQLAPLWLYTGRASSIILSDKVFCYNGQQYQKRRKTSFGATTDFELEIACYGPNLEPVSTAGTIYFRDVYI